MGRVGPQLFRGPAPSRQTGERIELYRFVAAISFLSISKRLTPTLGYDFLALIFAHSRPTRLASPHFEMLCHTSKAAKSHRWRPNPRPGRRAWESMCVLPELIPTGLAQQVIHGKCWLGCWDRSSKAAKNHRRLPTPRPGRPASDSMCILSELFPTGLAQQALQVKCWFCCWDRSSKAAKNHRRHPTPRPGRRAWVSMCALLPTGLARQAIQAKCRLGCWDRSSKAAKSHRWRPSPRLGRRAWESMYVLRKLLPTGRGQQPVQAKYWLGC